MNTLATLAFFAHHPGLHTFSKDRNTLRAVKRLELLGFLLVSWQTGQAEFTGKVFNQ